MADSKHDSINKDAPASITQGDMSRLFTTLNAITSRFDDLEKSTTTMVNSVNSHILQLEKDLADDSTSAVHDFFSPTSDPVLTHSLFGTSYMTTHSVSTASSNIPLTTVSGTKSSILDILSKDKSKRKHYDDSDGSTPEPRKKKHRKHKKSKHRYDTSSDSESSNSVIMDEQMEELINEYKSTKPKYLEDPVTVPIPEPLAKTLETWFWSVYSRDEVKAELAKPSHPSNDDALIPTRINEAVFRSLDAVLFLKICQFVSYRMLS